MLWMRPKRATGKTTVPYHIPYNANDANQNMHYVKTLCNTEIKTIYNNWEIKEDPPKDECCQKCADAWKKKMTVRLKK